MKMNWINCKKASEIISESIDRPLPIYKKILLRFHLRMCKSCLKIEQQFKALHNILSKQKNMPHNEEALPSYTASLPSDVREEMKKLIKKKLTIHHKR